MATIPDLTTSGWSDDQLQVLQQAVFTEIARRQALSQAPAIIDEQLRLVNTALGRKDGDEWAQPTGAVNAYPQGAIVKKGGKRWESTVPVNVWEPGTANWREAPTTGTTPGYAQPTGATDAYQVGNRVSFEGEIYESLIPNNVWSPASYANGWRVVA